MAGHVQRPAIPIIGASIPRSGHHHLARLVEDYFGPRLKYCSVYDVVGCCRQAPCAKAEGRAMVFQKSHDFAFRLPRDISGAIYLIQHRHPVSNAISGAELRSRKSGMRPPSESLGARIRYYDFLAHRLAYYKRFHDKWMVAPPARAALIDHARLEHEPEAVLQEIAELVGSPPDQERAAATATRLRDRGGGRKATYAPRVVEDSRFFDREALAAYEAAVIEHCPAFGFAATLGGTGYRRHPVWLLARLRHGFGRPFPPDRSSEFD
ncbi:hypothetical protein [Hansschlegelia zhihuaiae]|uniref:Sulfotransferase family protein n=1 Tax=Hansschlegelia zhihuaiae TaxID=405005 RepID=A0A4Q0MHH8_9HYPH|nr:hypothetical protein [Hansschlegelia zhihuaiae]RXF73027.1 hypothetical protein EK403_12900 [Hansschlegelia zhihuaiae]